MHYSYQPLSLGLTCIYIRESEPVYRHSLNKQAAIRKLKQSDSDSALISIEEKHELIAQWTKRERELLSQIEFNQNQVGVISDRNEKMEGESTALNATIAKLTNENDNFAKKYEILVSENNHLKAALTERSDKITILSEELNEVKNQLAPKREKAKSTKKYVDMAAEFNLLPENQIQKFINELPENQIQKFINKLPENQLQKFINKLPENQLQKLIDGLPKL